VDVEAPKSGHLQELGSEDLPVGGDDDDVGRPPLQLGEGLVTAKARGLEDRDAGALGGFLDGRRPERPTAAGWAVGLRHNTDNLVGVDEPS
jgi:hypothetical protein